MLCSVHALVKCGVHAGLRRAHVVCTRLFDGAPPGNEITTPAIVPGDNPECGCNQGREQLPQTHVATLSFVMSRDTVPEPVPDPLKAREKQRRRFGDETRDTISYGPQWHSRSQVCLDSAFLACICSNRFHWMLDNRGGTSCTVVSRT